MTVVVMFLEILAGIAVCGGALLAIAWVGYRLLGAICRNVDQHS